MIRAIVVDDMPAAIARLRRLLGAHADVQIVGAATGAEEASMLIQSTDVDLMFLDIEMPSLSGFDLLKNLDSQNPPHVIFVTAYSDRAVDAFRVDAVDYLLKPVDDGRLAESLDKVRRLRAVNTSGASDRIVQEVLANLGRQYPNKRKFLIKERGRKTLVDVDAIEWIEAAGNYVILHVGKERHMVRAVLSDMPARLEPGRFVRVSKSALVNVNHVRSVSTVAGGEQEVRLDTGDVVTVSRAWREEFETALAGI